MAQEIPPEIRETVSRFSQANILVIGDVIVDHFVWGSVSRISPEAPVPVVNVTREQLLLGGAANVLRNIVSLGGRGALCGMIGDDIMGRECTSLLAELPASDEGLIHSRRPTIVKTRVVAQGQQVVRYDREVVGPPSPATLEKIKGYLTRALPSYDAVVVSDYAKGVVDEDVMRHLQSLLRQQEQQQGRSIPLIVDPKPIRPARFRGATVMTPNQHEAELLGGVAIQDDESLLVAARRIRRELDCRSVLITRGEAGMALLDENGELSTIPTMAREVYDVTGAGDTVAAALALGMASGCTVAQAARLANYAAGVVVGKVGTASVTAAELLDAVATRDTIEE
ncbi:MAG: rfaE bifunctional protein [Desulfobulbaceae bacterium A2]|nr:MAG: rfaE bifunctional protein [Desulfobulbaceae bacterium A2]